MKRLIIGVKTEEWIGPKMMLKEMFMAVLNLGNIHLLQTLKKNFISAALKRL